MIETSELRFEEPGGAPAAPKLVSKPPVTPPWKSWKTLAEVNGCQTTLPDVTVVPTRTLRRPRVLSIPLKVKSKGGTNPDAKEVPTTPVAGTFNGSTCVLDQTIPADGSTNQWLLSF